MEAEKITRSGIKNTLFFLFFAVCLTTTSYAADARDSSQNNTPPPPPQGEKKGPPKAPPQAAIDACSGKNEGDTCECKDPKGKTESGICAYTPDKKYFACRPDHPPKGGRDLLPEKKDNETLPSGENQGRETTSTDTAGDTGSR
jgi:hypothetical protein